MNKLEICITESEGKEGISVHIPVEVKLESKISAPRCVCVEYFKIALKALEKADEEVFMDALESYLKEKSGE